MKLGAILCDLYFSEVVLVACVHASFVEGVCDARHAGMETCAELPLN